MDSATGWLTQVWKAALQNSYSSSHGSKKPKIYDVIYGQPDSMNVTLAFGLDDARHTDHHVGRLLQPLAPIDIDIILSPDSQHSSPPKATRSSRSILLRRSIVQESMFRSATHIWYSRERYVTVLRYDLFHNRFERNRTGPKSYGSRMCMHGVW